MKAFVLAGGLGTRLRPKFGELPKPLAPLGGRPFLERQLDELQIAGVRISWDMGSTLYDLVRRTGWRRLR